MKHGARGLRQHPAACHFLQYPGLGARKKMTVNLQQIASILLFSDDRQNRADFAAGAIDFVAANTGEFGVFKEGQELAGEHKLGGHRVGEPPEAG